MGLFKSKHKSQTDDGGTEAERRFFDENFREELRNHGRLYFEKVISENGVLFKEDLDATITQLTIGIKEHVVTQLDATIAEINVELKDHAEKQLDAQYLEYTKAMKGAEDVTLQSLTTSAQTLQQQHEQLSATLQKSIANQGVMLSSMFQENMAQMTSMKAAQAAAVQSLASSAQAMQEQYQQLTATLQKNVTAQEEVLIKGFETNMAQIIEHYLLGALGDQYDLKAQLPSIIKQLEANKQAIVDDIKL